MSENKTHAEIEAEIFDLILAAKGYAKEAEKTRDDLRAAAADLKAANSGQQDTAAQLQKLRGQIQKDAQTAMANEAVKIRRSAVLAQWSTIGMGVMSGFLVGVVFMRWWLGAF